jgi:hypothetical protein
MIWLGLPRVPYCTEWMAPTCKSTESLGGRFGIGQRERSRQAPLRDGERDERGDRRDQKDQKIVDAVRDIGAARTAVDKTINVLSNALIASFLGMRE